MEYEMKKLVILSVIIIGGFIGATDINAHHGVSNYFYTGLHPHGTWVEIDVESGVFRGIEFQDNQILDQNAFRFSRPEDLATDPNDGTRVR